MSFRIAMLFLLLACQNKPNPKSSFDKKTERNRDQYVDSTKWENSISAKVKQLKIFSKKLNAIDKIPEPERDLEYPILNNLIKEELEKLLQSDSLNNKDIFDLFKFSDIHVHQSDDKKFITVDWFTNNGGTFHIYSYFKVAMLNNKRFIQFEEEDIPPKEIYKLKSNINNIYLVISKGRTCGTCLDLTAETYLVDNKKGIIPYNCFAGTTNFLTLQTRLQENLIFNFDTTEQELIVAYTVADVNTDFEKKLGDRIKKVYSFDGKNFKLKK